MINELRHLDNQSYSTKNRNDSYIYDIPTCWYVGGNKTIVSKVCINRVCFYLSFKILQNIVTLEIYRPKANLA